METSAGTGTAFPNVAVAFEGEGQLLATYGKSGQNLVYYRVWNNSVGWSSESSGPTSGKIPNSMMLTPDPNSNTIVLCIQDSDKDLNVVFWNNNAWDSLSELETDTGETKNQPFIFLW